MQELLFLLVLMVMTGLGVRMLLMQLDGRGARLPRPSLPKLSRIKPSLPKLPLRGRRRPRRSRAASAPAAPSVYTPIYDEEDDDLDQFAPSRSPYGLATVTGPAYLDEADEDEEDDDLVPVNQVDFFNDEPEVVRRPAAQIIPASESEDEVEAQVLPQIGHAPEDGTEQEPEAQVIAEVPQGSDAPAPEPEVEIPTDPDDILSFFEKPAAMTQLPETLREAVEAVSAAELLAEARQVSQLIRGRQRSA